MGAQMHFDRLVRAVDEWARERGRPDVFAQIGHAEYVPTYVEHTRLLEPPEFDRRYREADVIVAHAGTGSILQAMELSKPILVMPRRAKLRETRNDHQVATAERFARLGIPVAWDETELRAQLDGIDALVGQRRIGPDASEALLSRIRAFIASA
ncbi:MAG: glycosyltransferase [Polyangiales bacterium]